jgi:hypothetical protein
MHLTFILDDNPNPMLHRQPQDIIFPDNLLPDHQYCNFRGQAKGMKAVLEEWGLWDYLCAQNRGKPLFGDSAKCKLSQKAHDALGQSAAAQSLFDDAEDKLNVNFDQIGVYILPSNGTTFEQRGSQTAYIHPACCKLCGR